MMGRTSFWHGGTLGFLISTYMREDGVERVLLAICGILCAIAAILVDIRDIERNHK